MSEKRDLFVRNLTKEQKVWVASRCAEENIKVGQYIGKLIDREKKEILNRKRRIDEKVRKSNLRHGDKRST